MLYKYYSWRSHDSLWGVKAIDLKVNTPLQKRGIILFNMEFTMNELKEETIEQWALEHEAWRESARGVLTDGWDIKAEVEYFATQLAGEVCRGFVSVEELRGGVSWVNALDKEATERFGSDLSVGDFKFERTTRRIMNHAGRMALEQVNNKSKRIILQSKYTRFSTIGSERV